MAVPRKSIRQAAALAVRHGRICVVTSSSGKRWVVPKGCCERGKTEGQIAPQEAWEEAGLAGVLEREPVGSYLYRKAGNVYHVSVYLLRVTFAASRWPEKLRRRRLWLEPEHALERIDDAGLCDILRAALAVHSPV
jgi:8-oxo-dGTP pyrophosphatase MutT (NUDIX family)